MNLSIATENAANVHAPIPIVISPPARQHPSQAGRTAATSGAASVMPNLNTRQRKGQTAAQVTMRHQSSALTTCNTRLQSLHARCLEAQRPGRLQQGAAAKQACSRSGHGSGAHSLAPAGRLLRSPCTASFSSRVCHGASLSRTRCPHIAGLSSRTTWSTICSTDGRAAERALSPIVAAGVQGDCAACCAAHVCTACQEWTPSPGQRGHAHTAGLRRSVRLPQHLHGRLLLRLRRQRGGAV